MNNYFIHKWLLGEDLQSSISYKNYMTTKRQSNWAIEKYKIRDCSEVNVWIDNEQKNIYYYTSVYNIKTKMIISHFLKLFQPSVDFCSARIYICCCLFILSRNFMQIRWMSSVCFFLFSQFLTLFLFLFVLLLIRLMSEI